MGYKLFMFSQYLHVGMVMRKCNWGRNQWFDLWSWWSSSRRTLSGCSWITSTGWRTGTGSFQPIFLEICSGERMTFILNPIIFIFLIFKYLFRAVGENPTKEELQDFINMIDKDATGIIKFPDFLFMMASKVLRRLIANCFLLLILDRFRSWGTGYQRSIYNIWQCKISLWSCSKSDNVILVRSLIIYKYLRMVTETFLGLNWDTWWWIWARGSARRSATFWLRWTLWSAQNLSKDLQEADVDGDGCINFEEFVGMMKSAGHYSRVDGSWQGNQEK